MLGKSRWCFFDHFEAHIWIGENDSESTRSRYFKVEHWKLRRNAVLKRCRDVNRTKKMLRFPPSFTRAVIVSFKPETVTKKTGPHNIMRGRKYTQRPLKMSVLMSESEWRNEPKSECEKEVEKNEQKQRKCYKRKCETSEQIKQINVFNRKKYRQKKL